MGTAWGGILGAGLGEWVSGGCGVGDGRKGTMFSSRWGGAEGAGFWVEEAAETGAAVVGQVHGEGCDCG